MNSNNNFDLFSMLPEIKDGTIDGDQFIKAGICSLSDVLDMPLNLLFQTAIMEHYRTCRLNYAACSRLINLLNEKEIRVLFDKNIEPDISVVPKAFSSVVPENEEIAIAFDRLSTELGRLPATEEIAAELCLPADSLRNNIEITKLSLEHQQVMNYIEWFCGTYACDIYGEKRDGNGLEEINWDMYPYNLLLDVVPAVEQIKSALKKEPGFFSRFIQRLENLVYFDLPTEEKNIIAALYIEGAIHFREPALQWGLEHWCCSKKHVIIRNVRGLFQGGKLLAEKGLLEVDAILEFSVEELGLSAHSYDRFKRRYPYIHTVAELVAKSRRELAKLHQHSLEEVAEKVHQLGLCFADEEPKKTQVSN